jgi:hypothetical protein
MQVILPEVLPDNVPWKAMWTEEYCLKGEKTVNNLKLLELLWAPDAIPDQFKACKNWATAKGAKEQLDLDEFIPTRHNTCLIDWDSGKSVGNARWTGLFLGIFDEDACDDEILGERGRLRNYLRLMHTCLESSAEVKVDNFIMSNRYANNSPWDQPGEVVNLAAIEGQSAG